MRFPSTHAYQGVKACGCVVLIFADMGQSPEAEERAWTASNCAEAVRDGLTLRRVTIEEARTGGIMCKHEPHQLGLLEGQAVRP